jgi:dTDP-4-dehydrorhamnose reductase
MPASHERWLITGAGGQLGSVLLRELVRQNAVAVGLLSPSGPVPHEGTVVRCDITDRPSLARLVRANRPTHIVHAAAVTRIQEAYDQPGLAWRINVEVTRELVTLSAEFASRFLYVSTDLVFDGTEAPYDEEAEARPLSVYGRTKLEGEQAVLPYELGLVARFALMYGLPAVDRPTTFQSQVAAIRDGQPLTLFEDEFRCPIGLDDAAEACLTASRSERTGVLHVGGPERLSRLEMGRIVASAIGMDGSNIVATRQGDHLSPEPRPRDVSLNSTLFERCFARPAGRPMQKVIAELAPHIRAG